MSSAYILRAVGTAATGSGALNPGAPAGKTNGDLLLLGYQERNNTSVLAAPNPPTGWILLSPSVNVTWNYIFGRIADGTASDTPTALTSSPADKAWCQIAAFHGDVYGTISAIVNVSNDKQLPGVQTGVNYAALTPTVPNCLVIAMGSKNKTSTSDGTTFNALSGFTQLSQYSSTNNGSDLSAYWGYVQQTTATLIAAQSQTLTGTTETLQNTSIMIALLTATGVSALPAAAAIFADSQD